MFSLFSSFDYNWFFTPTLLEVFFFFIFFCSTFFFCSKNFFFEVIKTFMVSFFNSLISMGGSKNSLSFLFYTMSFLFFLNFYSVFPFVFPFTSQVSLVFLLGLSFWLSFLMFFNFYSPKGFLSHCIPEGSPKGLAPILFLIELVSNIIRPITLTVRLVANILAGHLLLILLTKVVFALSSAMPLYFFLNLVEFFVAIVQSYIFLTMVTLYYCDVS